MSYMQQCSKYLSLEIVYDYLETVLNTRFSRKEVDITKMVFVAVFKPNVSYTQKEVLDALENDGPGFLGFSFSLGELLATCLPTQLTSPVGKGFPN